MTFAPESVTLTKIQWRILVDIDRMTIALNADSIPAAIAIHISRWHKGVNPEGTLRELVRTGYLLKKQGGERYQVGDKRIPQRCEQLPGVSSLELDIRVIKTIAAKWTEGKRDLDGVFNEERMERSRSRAEIERALDCPRYRINGSKTPTASWAEIMTDHMRVETAHGGALPTSVSKAVLIHHLPHLDETNARSKLDSMYNAGIVACDLTDGKWKRCWMVSAIVRDILNARRAISRMSDEDIQLLLKDAK